MVKKRLGVNSLAFVELLEQGVLQWELMEEIKRLGISKFEVRREWLKEPLELAKMKAVSNRLKIELYYSVPDLLFASKLINSTQLEIFFKEAREMGASKIKMTGGFTNDISDQEVATLRGVMKKYPEISLTIENNQERPYAQWQGILKLLGQCRKKELPIGYTYDMGNYIYVSEAADAELAEIATSIEVIHLKDVKVVNQETVLLGEGDINWSEILKALPNDLPLFIEYPCGSEPFSVLKKEIQKLEKEVHV